MDAIHRESAAALRALVERGAHDGAHFREMLSSVPAADRDAWLDTVLGIGELPDDGPELPRGCAPYLPSSVDVLMRVVEGASVRPSDVFVDVGAGLGRAGALVHLLTGARTIGLEIQPALVRAGRELAANLRLSRMPIVEGDAVDVTAFVPIASVYFLYCPFSGARLAKWLDRVEAIARTRTLRIACVDLELPPRPWLVRESIDAELEIHQTTA